MRRFLAVLFVVLACLVVAPSAAPQPPPVETFPCAVFSTGASYGQDHVAPAAQAGIVGHEHKPGFHRGFSQCVP
jgi:hypothetical protein